MQDEKQTSTTDTEELDVNSAVGQGDADNSVGSTDAVLETLNKVSGREFKSINDFEKHYKNLNSLVGDQSIVETKKKAEELDRYTSMLQPLAEAEGVSIATYVELLNKNAKGEDLSKYNSAKEYEQTKMANEELGQLKNRLSELEGELTKTKLERINPEAGKYFDDFSAWAKGKGLEATPDNFQKSPFMAAVEADRVKESSSIVETNPRITSSKTELDRVTEAYRKNPTEENAKRMVAAKMKMMLD